MRNILQLFYLFYVVFVLLWERKNVHILFCNAAACTAAACIPTCTISKLEMGGKRNCENKNHVVQREFSLTIQKQEHDCLERLKSLHKTKKGEKGPCLI